MTHIEILNDIRNIIFKYLDAPLVRVYLFGSWVKGEEWGTSDIYLAIDYDKPLPPGTISNLRTVLEKSRIPYRVDIVDLKRADNSFRTRVIQEGIEWKDCVKE